MAEVVAAAGDAPITVAEAARQLGVKKSVVRRAIESRVDGAAGLELVTDARGTRWVQRTGGQRAEQTAGQAVAQSRGPEPVVDLGDRGALRTAVQDARTALRLEQQRIVAELGRTTDPVRQAELRQELTGRSGTITRLQDTVDRATYAAEKATFLHRLRKPLDRVAQLRSDRAALAQLRERLDARGRLSREEYIALVADEIRRVDGITVGTEQIAGALLTDGLRPGLSRLNPRRVGTVIEMLTGEGKSYVGELVAVKRALDAKVRGGRGRGVHVMTTSPTLVATAVADYTRVADRFGLRVGQRIEGEGAAARRSAYDADITVGVASDFVFDWLAGRTTKIPGRDVIERGFALVDEADMVFLDQGASPYRLARSIGESRRAEISRRPGRRGPWKPRSTPSPHPARSRSDGRRRAPSGSGWAARSPGRCAGTW